MTALVDATLEVLDEALTALIGDAKVVRSDPGIRRLLGREMAEATRAARRAAGKRKHPDPELPPALGHLIDELGDEVERLTADLEAGAITRAAWEREIARLLTRYYAAARLAGAGGTKLAPAEIDSLVQQVATQLQFLRNFSVEIADEREFQAGWRERAQEYARGIKVPYWQGKTEMLPLPAMPGEGTQCLTNCRCKWRIVVVDRAAGDYDCYWEWEQTAEHCQTCTERHRQWYPLRIRGGVVE